MLKLLLGACVLATATFVWAQVPATVHQLARADGSAIEYYLQQRDPDNTSRQLLVVIQGSDCNSVRNIPSITHHMSNVLPSADVLTVEKYGIDASLSYNLDPDRGDCPGLYVLKDSPRQRLQDYRSVIAHLREQNDYRRVVVLGGSEGAVVAGLLASDSKSADVAIAMNGGGQRFIDDVLHSIETSTASAEEKVASAQGMREFFEHINTVPSAEVVASNHGYAWWKQMFELDQLVILQRAAVPVLIVQGEADQSVSSANTRQMLEQLVEVGKRNIVFYLYPQLDHQLNGPDGVSQMKAVVADIAAWLGDKYEYTYP